MVSINDLPPRFDYFFGNASDPFVSNSHDPLLQPTGCVSRASITSVLRSILRPT